MPIDAASKVSPRGNRVRMVSSNKRVKSKPFRQEDATTGPKTFSSSIEHPGGSNMVRVG